MPSIAQLSKLLEAEPHDPFLLYGLAQEYAKAGDLLRAVEHFDRCLAADATYCYAYYHKAKALIAATRIDDARAVIEAGMAKAREVGDAHARGELQALLYDLE